MAAAPLKLLSLDGGGVRGYSEIIMLEAIMKRVQKILGLEHVPLPADYFDLMGGTSTGGLIAIMLGRLRMSIQETTQAYEMLSERIFSKKSFMSKLPKKSRFDPEVFESIIQAVVNQKTKDRHSNLIDPEENPCKIFVTTVCTVNVPHIVMFRSYDAEYSLEPECRIWEAARATSAAPTYFAPIDIGPEGQKLTYVDGGLGCNNPIYQVHLEAERLFEASRNVACVVSMGTGQRNTNEISEPDIVDKYVVPKNLINSIKKLAIDCERKAEDMELKYQGIDDVYFRLNVEHGLENIKLADWEQLPTVRLHTKAYLEKPKVAETLDTIAALLAGTHTRPRTYSLGLLSFSNDKVIAAATGLPLNEGDVNFVGRRASHYTWLSSQVPEVNPKRDQNDTLAKRFVDTSSGFVSCSWFFKTEEFKAFESSHKPVALWVQGPQWCGKTVLTSAVIERLTSSDELCRVLYFYCRMEPTQTTLRDILYSFLSQATEWEDAEVMQIIQQFRTIYATLTGSDEMDKILLQLLLLVISTSGSRKVYIVIDSIEAVDSRYRPIQLLTQLICHVKGDLQPSLLFTSQRDGKAAFQKLSISSSKREKYQLQLLQVEIYPALTTPDLRAMVQFRVNNPDGPLGSKLQDQRNMITETIIKRAQGMFLYATLVLDELKGDKVASLGAIKSTLRSLPKDIHLSYKRHLESITLKRKAPEFLQWVYAALKELTWDEIRAGISVVDGSYDEDERIDQPAEEFIRETCGPLIELCGENKTNLRFIHPTVKEVLNQADGPGDLVEIQHAHAVVCDALLAMLMSADVPDFSRQTDDSFVLMAEYMRIPGRELYEYAVLNWYKHLQLCDKISDQLQNRLADFLASNSCLKWLIAILILNRVRDTRGDLFALVRDVTDCLWSWMRTQKGVLGDKTKNQISNWSEHFLNLMLDWKNALQDQPHYFYSLHFDLLPKESPFLKFIGAQTYQSVVRFGDERIITRSSIVPGWTNYVFAVDEARNWAYVYQNGYLECYHTETGLPVAETYLGHIGFQEAVLSPDKSYIALSFAKHRIQDAQIVAQIANILRGFHLTTYFYKGPSDSLKLKVVWCLESADFDDTSAIFQRFTGHWIEFDHVVCLVKLSYHGLSRTNLFGQLPGRASYDLHTWKAPVIWKVDNPRLLAFSTDSKYLSTPCGRTKLTEGTPTSAWPVNQHDCKGSLRSTCLSSDFGTVATIRDRKKLEIWDAQTDSLRSSIAIDGVGHILAVSSCGRYNMLLRIQTVAKGDGWDEKIGSPFRKKHQSGTVTIYDSQEQTWTDLAVLKPPMSRKSRPWAFHENPCKAGFAPGTSGTGKAMVYLPAKWTIADDVQYGHQVTEPNALAKRGHLLIFHSDDQASGFGPRPVLRYMIPLKSLTDINKLQIQPGQSNFVPGDVYNVVDNFHDPAVVSWDEHFETCVVYWNGKMSRMTVNDLQTLIFSEQRRRTTLEQQTQQEAEVVIAGGIFTPTNRDAMFRLLLIRECETPGKVGSLKSDALDSSQSNYTHHLLVERVGMNDRQPTRCAIRNILPPTMHRTLFREQHVSVSSTNRIRFGDCEYELIPTESGGLQASAKTNDITQAAIAAFAKASRPFQPYRRRAFLSSFLNSAENFHYAIFESDAFGFEEIIQRPETGMIAESIDRDVDSQASVIFIPVVTETCQKHLYFCQFSRMFDDGEIINEIRREARSFEVFLCIYDARKRDITWMTHTTTGGAVSDSEKIAPQAAWALHPTEPLLAWSLPGHRLKLSYIDSCFQPLSISEPITFDVDASESLSFSPDGRYLLARGGDTICNVFVRDRSHLGKTRISVFDLVTGFRTSLLLSSNTKLSVDIDDNYVRVYRISRDDAVEMNEFKLPNIVDMERFNLTYIPTDCCCVTCGIPFQKTSDIFVYHREHSINVVLSHDMVHEGHGLLHDRGCEPIMLRTSKTNSSLDIAANDALIPERTIGVCPLILNKDGKIAEDVFQHFSQADVDKLQILPPGLKYDFVSGHDAKELMKREVVQQFLLTFFQTAMKMDDFKKSNKKFIKHLESILKKSRSLTTEQPLAHIVNFMDVKDNTKVELEQIEDVVRNCEQLTSLSLKSKTDKFGRRAFEMWKSAKGGSGLPFDTWEEMMEMMQELQGNMEIRKAIERLWPPRDSGMGTRIPILIHTFQLEDGSIDADGRASPSLQWSCAMDIGWIEEDIGWYYERLLWGQKDDVRSFYIFPAMHKFGERLIKIMTDETEEGSKAREKMSPFFAKSGVSAAEEEQQPAAAAEESYAEPGVKGKKKMDQYMEGLASMDYEEFIENQSSALDTLSDISPGLGDYLAMRMKAVFQGSLDTDIEHDLFE